MNIISFLKKIWILLVSLLIIAAAVPSIYFYNKYRIVQNALENPTAFAKEEAKQLKEKVGKLIELPLDEEPTIASVTDADRLREQPFFANSQNGDRVLIFTQARKAILYRPSMNKIIEVAPVNIGNNQATPSASPVQAPSATPATTAPEGQGSPTPGTSKTPTPSSTRATTPTPTTTAQPLNE